MERLGWIGLGVMGTPMARNLERAGFPLSVYNRTPDKTKPFVETPADVCQTIAELVEKSDIIFTMLSDDAAVGRVYEEIFQSAPFTGKLFIDMSTISESLSKQIALQMQSKGGSFLDAPVAGSTKQAIEGTLIVLTGGDVKDIERARPYLEKLGKSIKHFGSNGKGIAVKLSINYFISLIYLGLSETVLFAESNGINKADILNTINESTGGSGATKLKTSLILSDNYKPQFALKLMVKDLKLAKENGINMPLTTALIDTYSKADEVGFGEFDVIGIIEYLRQKRNM